MPATAARTACSNSGFFPQTTRNWQGGGSAAQAPAIAGHDGVEIVTLHAEGAQLYECKPDAGNKPEPTDKNRVTFGAGRRNVFGGEA